MANLFNGRHDRSWLLGRVKDCIVEQPLLLVGFAAYWVWVNMVMQTPLLFHSLETNEGIIIPLRLAPIAFAFFSYLVISISFWKTKFVIKWRGYVGLLAVLMILGGLITVVCMDCAIEPGMKGMLVVALPDQQNMLLLITLYLIGSFLIGVASAGLCIEFQRVFGTLGSQYVLYIGCLAVALSCIVLIIFVYIPREALLCLLVLAPLFIAVCLRLTVKKIATKTYYTHGLNAKLIFPGKLAVTSTLHGLSLGVLIGFTPLTLYLSDYSLQALAGIFIGAVLLLTLSIVIKLDYNHLLYQVGFPLVALGALCLVCFTSVPLVGSILQTAGFSFIHLVMWGVCTYFITNLNLPATWTIGVSTCCFMLGQLLGSLISIAASHVEGVILSSQNLAAGIVFITLFASLLMMSSTNLRTGWGLARLDSSERPRGSTDETIISGLVAEYLLTERQSSILLLLVHGRNRRVISKELFISEETVKTHVQQIYRKLNVHSRQELIDFFDKRRTDMADENREPLFTSPKQ